MNTNRQRKMGSGGYCVCLKCGRREPHKSGVPCMKMRCPDCAGVMIREGSEHHVEGLAKAKARKAKDKST